RRPFAVRLREPVRSALHSLSLHDALPILAARYDRDAGRFQSSKAQRDRAQLARELNQGALIRFQNKGKCDEAGQISCTWSGSSRDRKSTRLNSSHRTISYAVFCLKKKTKN